MHFSTITPRQAVAALGACFALLLFASPASARPDGYQPQLKEDTVIPYLSHGEGIVVGQGGRPESTPTVIPYLSHGIGVEDTGSTALLRDQPDGFQPQLHGTGSAAVADDGFDWQTTGFVTGGIVAAMLLALLSTIALRDRRGLRSA